VEIRARVFVLALNALLTPSLLLRSADAFFPDGLGNSSGMIGRNLMVHASDMISLHLNAVQGQINGLMSHGLSLNDFYVRNGVKLGNIHAHAASFRNLEGEAAAEDEPSGVVRFSTIVEDFPYLDNMAIPKAGSEYEVCWRYRYPEELRARSAMLVTAFAEAIQSACEVSVRKPSGLLNSAHTCGTCRFGDDPRHSVLDRDNRIHDLENAYVVDASFFPSSGGIHPTLTIVANAIRASNLIAMR
jgi:choline dehydrogenase-like flavoprotein